MNFTKEVGSKSGFVNRESLHHLGKISEKETTKSSEMCVVDSL